MAPPPTPPTVLITGCSDGGLGAALAGAFARRGFHVFATLRDPSKASAAALASSPSSPPSPSQADPHPVSSLTPGRIEVLPLDVTDPASIASCAAAVAARTRTQTSQTQGRPDGGGRLDVLVNNAGGMFVMPLLDTDVAAGRRLFDVNVWGLLAVTQAFAPMLVRAGGGGVVLNVASIAGAVRMAWQGVYNASKAAARWLSETLRIEMQGLGVRVITAMVGEVETNIYRNTRTPPSLPPSSYYAAVQDLIFRQGTGQMQQTNEDAAVTAENLVRDVLAGRDGHVWRGGVAGRAKYLHWMLPERLFEWFLHASRGVYQVQPPTE